MTSAAMTSAIGETDVRSLYRRAQDRFGERVHGVRDDRWTAATPCTDWDVRALVNHVLGEIRWAVPLFAGATIAEVGDRFDGDLLGDDPQASITRIAGAAMAAAREVTDGDVIVHASHGDVSTRTFLQRLTIARSLVAHYVATYLGSTACPLPEELARPLWEVTAPEADMWRALGFFRDPMPLPEHVSWRDRFLLTAGHLPHPLGH